MFCFASIQLRPISDYDMLTVGRSARDLLRKKIAEQKKKCEVEEAVISAREQGHPSASGAFQREAARHNVSLNCHLLIRLLCTSAESIFHALY